MSGTFDTDFYKRLYGGGIELGAKGEEEGKFAILPGGRYSLAHERIRSLAKPDHILVELGCGLGHTLLALAEGLAIKRVIGIDVAFKEPQSFGAAEFRNHNLNEDWPFEDSSIDHLVAMMVFEHLFDPFHSFKEVRRTLTPTGAAYVNLPLVTALPNRLRLLFGKLPVTSIAVDRWFDEQGWDGNHLHYYSVDTIKRLAAFCGLRVGEMRGVGKGHKLKTMFPDLLASELTFSLHRS